MNLRSSVQMAFQKWLLRMEDDLINISDINQYLYCPRRFWYLKFYDTQGLNYYRADGKIRHENQSKRGGWTKEIYLESQELGLKGKIDVLEERNNVPVERKRGDDYYKNDEIQLAGYCMLLEDNTDDKVEKGIIYLFGTDRRHEIKISKWHKEKVKEVVENMLNMDVNSPPTFVSNLNKCKKCSTRKFCMPKESEKLGEKG